jgi:hypothetical protein
MAGLKVDDRVVVTDPWWGAPSRGTVVELGINGVMCAVLLDDYPPPEGVPAGTRCGILFHTDHLTKENTQ